MAWFRKTKKPKPVRTDRRVSSVPEGLWVRCDGCKEIIYQKELARSLDMCPKCGHHFRIGPDARIRLLLDAGDDRDAMPGERLFTSLGPTDPLSFRDSKAYKDRIKVYQRKVGVRDAVIAVAGTIEGIDVILVVMDYRFMGGSMGSVVGEAITRSAEEAVARHVPLIVVSASGGARMQEGVLSLMQMAKVSAALAKVRNARLPYISILTDPTTGGVTASFAMLGDLNISEPGALIGFAGPRVIEQTIRQSLPEGFQRSEFLLEKGFLDLVVPRPEMKATVARSLRHFL